MGPRWPWRCDRIPAPVFGLIVLAAAVAEARAAELRSRHGEWALYRHAEADQRLCFLAAEPNDRLPRDARQNTPFFYVAAWPGTRVRAEVSVRMGHPLRKGDVVRVRIDEQAFELFADADQAFAPSRTLEDRLLEALRTGSRMTLAAVSERGTATTDTYLLAGLAQGLQAMAEDCP